MTDIKYVLESLEKIPTLLKNLIEEIPRELLKQERITGKWSIYEHACHIIVVQPMLIKRMEKFINETSPVFEPYFPNKMEKPENLMNMDLNEKLNQFPEYRKKLINLVVNFSDEDFNKKASHPEYRLYTPYILLRHILMHDMLHMYKIEELWLTNDSYLPQ